jgi:SsrA-binding protein
MVRPRPEEFDKKKVVAENRRARFDYAIEDKYEAGIALTGTEVKSCASARARSPKAMPR